jgi:hypothetical protein
MNPIYNGWIRRYRRSRTETRKPAPWRSNPLVSDALWARIEDVRRSKTRAGGPKNTGRVDLLKGLIECVCGRRVRSDGTFADGRHRKLHASPFADWGKCARLGDDVWEEPILAQLRGDRARRRDNRGRRRQSRLGAPSGRARSGADRAPNPRARAGACRSPRGCCLPRAAARAPGCQGEPRARERRRNLAGARRGVAPGAASDVEGGRGATGEGRPAPRHLRSITVAGRRIVSVRLTPSAYANGFALALPEKVAVARPIGVERAIPGRSRARSRDRSRNHAIDESVTRSTGVV